MKKLFCALLLAALLVCGALAEPADFSGSWYLEYTFSDDGDLYPEERGIELRLELNPYGSCL